MANKKIFLNPSQWVLDENGFVAFRYRIQTDDYNIYSAYSPTYSIEVPPAHDPLATSLFTSVSQAITYQSVGDNTLIRLVWSTTPQLDNMRFYVFVKNNSTGEFVYNQTVSNPSFSYVKPTAELETSYTFAVTLLNTTKTVTSRSKLFEETIVF